MLDYRFIYIINPKKTQRGCLPWKKKVFFYSLLIHVPLLAFNSSLTPSLFLSTYLLPLYLLLFLCSLRPFLLGAFSSFEFPHFIGLSANLANLFTSREATERLQGKGYGYFVCIATNNRRLQTKINTHEGKWGWLL